MSSVAPHKHCPRCGGSLPADSALGWVDCPVCNPDAAIRPFGQVPQHAPEKKAPRAARADAPAHPDPRRSEPI